MVATLEQLEQRVIAIEDALRETVSTQTWMAETLGRVAGVQATHTDRLVRLETKVDRIETDLKGLRADLPAMLVEAVREGLKK